MTPKHEQEYREPGTGHGFDALEGNAMTDIVERLQEYSVYGDDAKVRLMAALAKAEIKRLRTNAEYWRLLAERREARTERAGLDIPEAQTLDAPQSTTDAQPPQERQVALDSDGKPVYFSQASSVPDGYALVPLIPTARMIEIGCDNNPTMWNDGTPDGFAADVANDVYVSMVRACAVSSTEGK